MSPPRSAKRDASASLHRQTFSTVRTARPTTGSPLSVLEVGTAPFDPVSSCFWFFGRLDPTDPFIARERRNVLPRRQRFGVGDECLFQVRGEIVDHAARDRLFAQSPRSQVYRPPRFC